MGLGFKVSTKKKVNMIISDHVIRYLDASKPELDEIKSFGEKFIPSGIIEEGKIIDKERFLLLLQECVKEWKLKGNQVQFLVPDPFIVVRKIEIPGDIHDEEIKGYLFLELGSTIHLPFENPVFNYEVLGIQEGRKEILLFAAPEVVVQDYTQLFIQAGLEPIVADISPLAIYRLYYKLFEPQEDGIPILSLQFNLQTVTASIFVNHKLIFVRQLKMNVALDQWNIAQDGSEEKLIWNGDDNYLLFEIQEMVEEVERIINFYQYSLNKNGGDGISQILLTGDHPHLTDIKVNLEQSLETDIITLTKHSRLGKNLADQTSYYLLAGLALKGGV